MRTDDDDDDELEGTPAASPRSSIPLSLVLGVGLVVVLLGPLLAVLVFMFSGSGAKPAPTEAARGPSPAAPAPSGEVSPRKDGAVGLLGQGGAVSLPEPPQGAGSGPSSAAVGGGRTAPGAAAEAFRPPTPPPTPEAGQPLYQWDADGGGVTGLALLADDRTAVLGTTNGVRIVDLESRKEKQRFAEGLNLSVMVVSPDGKRLLTGGGTVETKDGKRVPRDCVVRLWDLGQGQELRKLEGHTRPITTVAFSKDGRFGLSAGGGEDRGENSTTSSIDCGIRIWNLITYQQLAHLEGHKGPVRCLAFANQDQGCVSGGSDSTLRYWDFQTGQARMVMHAGAPVTCVACSLDGQLAVSGQSDGSVIQWNLHTGQALKRYEVPGVSKNVHWVGLSSDGGRLLSAHGWMDVKDGKTVPIDSTVRSWSLFGERPPDVFSEHTQMVKAVAEPHQQPQGGAWLISAGQDRTLRLWRLP